MQAVILAAGKGTRMGNLTRETPKPLLKAKGKTLLEYKLDVLPTLIDNVVLVVGHHGNVIKNYIGPEYRGMHVSYAWQYVLNGTAGALHAAKDLLETSFIVMMGDDIYDQEDIETCILFPWALSAKEISDQYRGGELITHPNGTLASIYEEKRHIKKGIINSGLYMLQRSFLNEPMVRVGKSREYGLPHTLISIAQKKPVHVHISEHSWIQITNQEDLEQYSSLL